MKLVLMVFICFGLVILVFLLISFFTFLCCISVQKMLQFLKNKQINFVSMEYLKRSSSIAVIKKNYG